MTLHSLILCDIIYQREYYGGDVMQNTYKKLDMSTLRSRKHTAISTKQALSNIAPLELSSTVYDGSQKIQIDKQGISYVPNR